MLCSSFVAGIEHAFSKPYWNKGSSFPHVPSTEQKAAQVSTSLSPATSLLMSVKGDGVSPSVTALSEASTHSSAPAVGWRPTGTAYHLPPHLWSSCTKPGAFPISYHSYLLSLPWKYTQENPEAGKVYMHTWFWNITIVCCTDALKNPYRTCQQLP